MLKLVSDENFNADILRGLYRQCPGLDIVRVQDIGLSDTPDPDKHPRPGGCTAFQHGLRRDRAGKLRGTQRPPPAKVVATGRHIRQRGEDLHLHE